ncbi:MAG: hypothetical protein LC644_02180, partial [Pseudonocardia sp.]|nr:hypothetical protein [Pseudonocardia sp.]
RFMARPELSGASGRVCPVIDELTLGVMPSRGLGLWSVGCSPSACCAVTGTAACFKDIYLLASAPADLAARSQDATLLVPGRGVLSGYSAAGCSVHDVHRRTRTPS